MADIFGGFPCIRFAGYLELCGVLHIIWGTSNCAGYPYLYGVPQVMPDTSDCAGIIPLVDTWRFIAFPIFPSNTLDALK